MAPKISPWGDADFYPALYGHSYVQNVTIAEYGTPCKSGWRAGLVDRVFISNPVAPDATHPMTLRNIHLEHVSCRASF